MNKHNCCDKQCPLAKFLPLIIIFTLIFLFTIIRQLYYGWDMFLAMNDSMGAFFIIFGTFKFINLKAFAEAYRSYDLIAKKSLWYSYSYPFIELALGIFYVLQIKNKFLYIFTLLLMLINSIGVMIALYNKEQVTCACLGAVFKIPMTHVTLFEDLSMALMALMLLFL